MQQGFMAYYVISNVFALLAHTCDCLVAGILCHQLASNADLRPTFSAPNPNSMLATFSLLSVASVMIASVLVGLSVAEVFTPELLCMQVRVVRIFNTYGPRMALDDGRVVSNFVAQALTDQDLTVYGDGQQTRSFQYVSDLIKGKLYTTSSLSVMQCCTRPATCSQVVAGLLQS